MNKRPVAAPGSVRSLDRAGPFLVGRRVLVGSEGVVNGLVEKMAQHALEFLLLIKLDGRIDQAGGPNIIAEMILGQDVRSSGPSDQIT
jgi:hypothetical protein